MRKTLYLLIFSVFGLLLPGFSAQAQVRFTYGAEWGYTATAYQTYHYNYLSQDEVRVDEEDARFSYKSNGLFVAEAGVEIARKATVTLQSGIMGIYERRNIVPVLLRGAYFFRGTDRPGFSVFLAAGAGYSVNHSLSDQYSLIGKTGLGFRQPIHKHFCLDLSFSLQAATDHPLHVHDMYTDEVVPPARLRRSDVTYLAANLTVALHF